MEHFYSSMCVSVSAFRCALLSTSLFPCPWVHFYEKAGSHACACNPIWSFRIRFVVLVQSAQRGDWTVWRQPAAATSVSDQHYIYWAEYWSAHPNCAAAKWPRQSLPSWQNETWIHFTALDTNMKNMRYTSVFKWWLLLWGCWSVPTTYLSHSLQTLKSSCSFSLLR